MFLRRKLLILRRNYDQMDIQAEIKWIQSELSKVKDPTLIEVFVKLLKNRKLAIESLLEEYNRELDEANARIESGKFITQEDLEEEASHW
jgi:predicted transcriptional regulator